MDREGRKIRKTNISGIETGEIYKVKIRANVESDTRQTFEPVEILRLTSPSPVSIQG